MTREQALEKALKEGSRQMQALMAFLKDNGNTRSAAIEWLRDVQSDFDAALSLPSTPPTQTAEREGWLKEFRGLIDEQIERERGGYECECIEPELCGPDTKVQIRVEGYRCKACLVLERLEKSKMALAALSANAGEKGGGDASVGN